MRMYTLAALCAAFALAACGNPSQEEFASNNASSNYREEFHNPTVELAESATASDDPFSSYELGGERTSAQEAASTAFNSMTDEQKQAYYDSL